MKKYFVLLLLCVNVIAYSLTTDSKSTFIQPKNQQLIMVITPSWDAVDGQIVRYQRTAPGAKWNKVGEAIPVVVGQTGMAWDAQFMQKNWTGPIKREGDKRTPVGFYQIGPAFGFNATPDGRVKLDYFPLKDTSVCVDDQKSQYYTQLLDQDRVNSPDWNSGEQMRTIPVYKKGVVVQYNTNLVRGAGSCIFLHIWKGKGQGTAGCVAAPESNLQEVLNWIDPAKKPVIAMLSAPAYRYLKVGQSLPRL